MPHPVRRHDRDPPVEHVRRRAMEALGRSQPLKTSITRAASAGAFITPPLKSTWVGHASPLGPRRTGAPLHAPFPLPHQEPRKMTGHRRIGGVRQTQLLKADPSLPGRHSCAGHCGEKPFSKHLVDILARQRCGHGGADEPRPAAEQCHRVLRLGRVGQEGLLGQAALVPQPCRCQVSMRWPDASSRCCSTRASARSMLSPPSRMCSPTATRSSASSPSASAPRSG